jgi:hypothetical protein
MRGQEAVEEEEEEEEEELGNLRVQSLAQEEESCWVLPRTTLARGLARVQWWLTRDAGRDSVKGKGDRRRYCSCQQNRRREVRHGHEPMSGVGKGMEGTEGYYHYNTFIHLFKIIKCNVVLVGTLLIAYVMSTVHFQPLGAAALEFFSILLFCGTAPSLLAATPAARDDRRPPAYEAARHGDEDHDCCLQLLRAVVLERLVQGLAAPRIPPPAAPFRRRDLLVHHCYVLQVVPLCERGIPEP